MQFTKDKYRLAGAFIETYLLEKSRVLSQGKVSLRTHVRHERLNASLSCRTSDMHFFIVLRTK